MVEYTDKRWYPGTAVPPPGYTWRFFETDSLVVAEGLTILYGEWKLEPIGVELDEEDYDAG